MSTRRQFLQATAAVPLLGVMPERNRTRSTSSGPFVHLHVHSEYSYPDAVGKIDVLTQRTKELGMNALALTDRGNLAGAMRFVRSCGQVGIKPILGCEAFVSQRDHRDHSDSGAACWNLTLLARNEAGFRNLLKLSTTAHLEGFHHRPRIDRRLLEKHSAGLICLTGPTSDLGTLVRHGKMLAAERAIGWYRRVFKNRHFIEIQNLGSAREEPMRAGLVRLAQRQGIPLVATHDVHYVMPDDRQLHDLVYCRETEQRFDDPERSAVDDGPLYLRSPAEMYAALPGHEEALRRTQEIADLIDFDGKPRKRHSPNRSACDAPIDPGRLRDLCLTGLKERYAEVPEMLSTDGELAAEVTRRLDQELTAINRLGLVNYFLMVWDLVRFAREHGIPYSTHGAAVGAIVSFGLKLSHCCPLQYGLLFERFLEDLSGNHFSLSIEVCRDRRQELVDYARRRYGTTNVAQVGTFSTWSARAALRDVGHALGRPIPCVDAVVALIPEELGISLDQALEKNAELNNRYEIDPEISTLYDLARKVEGMVVKVGTQVIAVVMDGVPLSENVPLWRAAGSETVVTQWSSADIENMGVWKVDLLGHGNLTLLAGVVDLIAQTTGNRIDPYRLPLDDAATFALLSRGETLGVHPLESDGVRSVLRQLQPDCFSDLIAVNALYRPNPLDSGMLEDYLAGKHGRRRPTRLHPFLHELLEETYGVLVYQEQVMNILNGLGKIELSDAYRCIRAISKRRWEVVAQYRVQFVVGCRREALTEADAVSLFERIEKFAGYAFSKSYSTTCAQIAYAKAYLKAHYPAEFMATVLRPGQRGWWNRQGFRSALAACEALGIAVIARDDGGLDIPLQNGVVVRI